MANPMIVVDRVTRRFGSLVAVDDVSLSVPAGGFFSLLGPSGCGKSTLMRMIAGFERPDAGSVTVAGEDMAGVPPYRRPINMMFQSYALFPHLTVAGNIAFGLEQMRLPREEIAKRVQTMLSLVKLDQLGTRKPDQLSGGQRQRVALARALAREPKVLLLDEPLGALDRRLREETQGELKRIQADLGTTFVIVTHDQDEAMTLSDAIAVMDKGRILQVGAPQTIYENPVDRRVAGTIGECSFLPGRLIAREGDRLTIAAGPITLEAVAPADGVTQALLAGQGALELLLAVRPEKPQVVPPGEGAQPNTFSGAVRSVAYRGDGTLVGLALADSVVLRVLVPHSGRAGRRPAPGDRLTIMIPPASLIVLPP
jgi:spermidine/putrescine ABC transporter ATP-binding subunit